MNTDLTKETLDAQYPLPDDYRWNMYYSGYSWGIENKPNNEPVAWIVKKPGLYPYLNLYVYFGPVGTVSPYEEVPIDTEDDGINLMYTRCLLGMV